MAPPTIPLHKHQKLQLRTTNLETLAAIDTAIIHHLNNPTPPGTISHITHLALQQLATIDPEEAHTLEDRLRYNDQGGPLQYRQKFLNRLTA